MRLRFPLPLLLAALCFLPVTPVHGQTLQEFSTVKSGTKQSQLVVFASGDAKTVVAQSNDATSAAGSLGMTYIGNHFIVSGVVNVPAKTDTIMSGYGASMLAPAAGTRTSALLDIRWPAAFKFTGCRGAAAYLCQLGVHGYAAASGAKWGADATTTEGPHAEDVSTWATGLGTSFVFFDGWLGEPDADGSSRVGMSLDVLGALRTVRGNLGMASDSVRRAAFLGTTARAFGGAEIGLNLRYNEANAALTYYHLGGSVPGFSGGQVVAGISFRTKLNGGIFTDAR